MKASGRDVRVDLEEIEPELETLASRMNLGTIERCPRGFIHFVVGTNRFRLSERQFWTFVDMIYESGRTVASRPAKRKRKWLW
jgi:hypothetical protein